MIRKKREEEIIDHAKRPKFEIDNISSEQETREQNSNLKKKITFHQLKKMIRNNQEHQNIEENVHKMFQTLNTTSNDNNTTQ